MRSFEETVPCTQFYESEDREKVSEWTRGAKEACAEFRSMIHAFIGAARGSSDGAKGQLSVDYDRGRAAFLAGLAGLL